ncbi:hypothetical protein L3H37_10900, partial [Corynebacterium sp. MC-20]|uniref:hypothetical protein n=1 Tax=Corynebacterium parakroppenstedtii TaxID=2828363 RepID=UPI001F3C2DC0
MLVIYKINPDLLDGISNADNPILDIASKLKQVNQSEMAIQYLITNGLEQAKTATGDSNKRRIADH